MCFNSITSIHYVARPPTLRFLRDFLTPFSGQSAVRWKYFLKSSFSSTSSRVILSALHKPETMGAVWCSPSTAVGSRSIWPNTDRLASSPYRFSKHLVLCSDIPKTVDLNKNFTRTEFMIVKFFKFFLGYKIKNLFLYKNAVLKSKCIFFQIHLVS